MEDEYEKSEWKGPSSGGSQKLFTYYHQADYLEEALLENEFEIIDLSRQEFSVADSPSYTDLLILATLNS